MIHDLLKRLVLAACVGLGFVTAATAQDFPSKPVRIIVPYGAGTASDTLARRLAPKLSALWRQGVVVENVTGAGGVVGTQQLARSEPDGHTLAVLASGHAMNVALYPKLPFNPLEDFTPIMQVAEVPMVIVAPASRFRDLRAFIDEAKSNPGKIDYGSTGNGSLPHLTVELLIASQNLHVVHVPYRNTGAMLPDLLTNRVSLASVAMATAVPLQKSGKLDVLAVSTPRRAKLMPDVPSVSEVAAGYDVSPWLALLAPRNLAPAISAKIYADVSAVMASEELRVGLSETGIEPNVRPGDEFWKGVEREIPKWQGLVRDRGIKGD